MPFEEPKTTENPFQVLVDVKEIGHKGQTYDPIYSPFMCLRSGYFQQIEVDVQKYAKPITELKSAINTFRAKDMTELIKFQKNVESILEHLTDESQVMTMI